MEIYNRAVSKANRKKCSPFPLRHSLLLSWCALFALFSYFKSARSCSKDPKSELLRSQRPPRPQQIHFRTYHSLNTEYWTNHKQRIVREANETGWFATAEALGPKNLSKAFSEKYSDILSLSRGGGYWIWRFDMFVQTMSAAMDGDILVFLDADCHLNEAGEKRFFEYIHLLSSSEYDVLGFQMGNIENLWTTAHLFRAFNVSDQVNITHTGQYSGGIVILQKGPHYREFIELCTLVLDIDPWMITDKYNNETDTHGMKVLDNRHDQSIQSVAKKLLGCVTVSADEHAGAKLDKPFTTPVKNATWL